MLEPFLLPLLAKIRRELSRLIFVGLLFAYGLAALVVCDTGGCAAGLRPAVIAIMGETRAYLWQGVALSFIVEFAGGFVAMTIGLALDWLKERRAAREKALAEAHAEMEAARAEQEAARAEREAAMVNLRAQNAEAIAAARAEKAEAIAEARAQSAETRAQLAESRTQLAESIQRNLELQNRMLRAGIDPDTGQRLPHFANANPGN